MRALAPWPGAWFEIGGERVKVLEAEPAAGSGAPGRVIDGRPTIACGEAALPAEAFLRGFRLDAGMVLP